MSNSDSQNVEVGTFSMSSFDTIIEEVEHFTKVQEASSSAVTDHVIGSVTPRNFKPFYFNKMFFWTKSIFFNPIYFSLITIKLIILLPFLIEIILWPMNFITKNLFETSLAKIFYNYQIFKSKWFKFLGPKIIFKPNDTQTQFLAQNL